jgi:hypothetical protein
LRAVSGIGSAGWLRTRARTAGSTAMASANPPVKHMPMARTPGPPHSPCACLASARSHVVTQLEDRELAGHATRTIERTVDMALSGSPGRPNSDGGDAVARADEPPAERRHARVDAGHLVDDHHGGAGSGAIDIVPLPGMLKAAWATR